LLAGEPRNGGGGAVYIGIAVRHGGFSLEDQNCLEPSFWGAEGKYVLAAVKYSVNSLQPRHFALKKDLSWL
jgi:hypothetical protein